MATFVSDNFAASAGTALESHTGATGATWFKNAAATSGTVGLQISPSGDVRAAGGSVGDSMYSAYTASGTPPTADYDVEADFACFDPLGDGTGGSAEVLARASTSAFTSYSLSYSGFNGNWQIIKRSGGYTSLATFNAPISNGVAVHGKLRIRGTTLTAYIGGTQRMSVTDSALAGPGAVGLMCVNGSSNTRGIHLRNFSASTIPVTVIPPDSSVICLSPGNQRIVAGTSLQWVGTATSAKFDFTGTSLAVSLDASAYVSGGIAAANFPYLDYSIDGGPWASTQVPNASTSVVPIASGLSAATHHAEIRYRPVDQTNSYNGPIDAILVTGWILDSDAALSAPTGVAAARPKLMMVFGDSITWGYAATDIALQSWGVVCAAALNAEVGAVGFSGQGWAKTASDGSPVFPTTFGNYTSGHPRSWPANLDYLVVCHGTNDAESVDVTSIVQAWLATARTAVGVLCKIVIVLPLNGQRSSQIIAGFVAYQTATPLDTFVYLIDVSDRIHSTATGLGGGTTETVDGIHPTTEGHALIGAAVAAETQRAIAATQLTAAQVWQYAGRSLDTAFASNGMTLITLGLGDGQITPSNGGINAINLPADYLSDAEQAALSAEATAASIAAVQAAAAAIKAKTDALPADPASETTASATLGIFAGITSLAEWLQLIVWGGKK